MLNLCSTYLNTCFNVKLVNCKWNCFVTVGPTRMADPSEKCELFGYHVWAADASPLPSLASVWSPRWSAWTSWWHCWGRCRSVWHGLYSPSSPGSAAGTSSWLETAGSGLSFTDKGNGSISITHGECTSYCYMFTWQKFYCKGQYCVGQQWSWIYWDTPSFLNVKHRCVHARVLHLHEFILILSHVCIYNKVHPNFFRDRIFHCGSSSISQNSSLL